MLARAIAIGFGIAVIFPLLVYYGVSTFKPAPDRMEFFPATLVPPSTAPAEERKAYNDEQQRRQQAFAAAAKDFGRVLIIVATVVGGAAILVGAYFPIHVIGTGLVVGGIFAVGWGYWTYWPYLDDWIRFISLLIAFAILLFVGYRRLGLSRSGSQL